MRSLFFLATTTNAISVTQTLRKDESTFPPQEYHIKPGRGSCAQEDMIDEGQINRLDHAKEICWLMDCTSFTW